MVVRVDLTEDHELEEVLPLEVVVLLNAETLHEVRDVVHLDANGLGCNVGAPRN